MTSIKDSNIASLPVLPSPEQHLALTDLVEPIPLTFSRSIVCTAFTSSSATYLLTAYAEQIRSEKSIRLQLISDLCRQKQNLTLNDLVRLAPLTISRSAVYTTTDCVSATYLLTGREKNSAK